MLILLIDNLIIESLVKVTCQSVNDNDPFKPTTPKIKHSGNAETGLPKNRETGLGPKFQI